MYFERLRRFWSCQCRVLVPLAVLCPALTSGNALVWLRQWNRSGIRLCGLDVVMASAQPSFSIMLMVPLCLVVTERSLSVCEPSKIVPLFSSRKQLFRTLAGGAICGCLVMQSAVAASSLVTGFALFGRPLTMNWNEMGSYYWYGTGQILPFQLAPAAVAIGQAVSALLVLVAFSLLFLILSLVGPARGMARGLGWCACLMIAWCCSFPVTPALAQWQRAVCYSVQKIEGNFVGTFLLMECCLVAVEGLLLWCCIKTKDFME